MKTLYIDCGMGAAGDMLTAALLELLPDPDDFVKELNRLGIPNVKYVAEKAEKCGITGTHMSVLIDGEEESEDMHEHHHEHEHHHGHHHSHNSMADIEHIVRDHLEIPEGVKNNIMKVYGLIAQAESSVHGKPVDEIHFHEVGSMDAVADVTAVCMLFDRIGADRIVVSPVHVGSGQVKCAHGILPVPAPATAYILRDIPIYGGQIKGELCTPTGAAILKCFATEFGDMPVMATKKIGYGMGKKDFERANLVRVLLGETRDNSEKVTQMSCNLDDMTGEAIGYATECLFEAGALDVFTIPIGMKKNRPGVMLNVLCNNDDKEKIAALIFKHTTTLGIRENELLRYTLDRECVTLATSFGEVRKKISKGYGVVHEKFEYDDLVKIAKEKGMSIPEVIDQISK